MSAHPGSSDAPLPGTESACGPDAHAQGRTGNGIGARVLRKEDARHLHGRGRFVGDIVMPDLMEVAFLRSPLAHARIRRDRKSVV